MRFVYIDENFSDAGGHNADYALGILSACEKREHSCAIYANRRLDSSFLSFSGIIPVFSIKTSTLHQIGLGRGLGRLGQAMRLAYSNISHGLDLLRKVNIGKDCSLVLIAGISPRVTLAYLVWFAYLSLIGMRTNIAILLHDQAPGFAGLELRLLRMAGFRQKIDFAAQSPSIAEQFRIRFHEPICIMPMPMVDHSRRKPSAEGAGQIRKEKINVLYLGLASSAKGFGFLVDTLTSCRAIDALGGALKFTIQYNPVKGDELAKQAGERLSAAAESCHMITVLRGPLAKDAYETQLVMADVMILPYDPRCYRYIQSGIITQAIAAGKPLIVSADSNLEKEMQLHGSGISFEYGSPASFMDALCHLVDNLDDFSGKAALKSAAYLQMHGPAAYVAKMEAMATGRPE